MDVSCYLLMTGEQWYADRRRAKNIRALAKKPSRLAKNEIAIKINLSVPDALFERPELQASIVIPDSAVNRPVIDAEVCDNLAQTLSDQLGLVVRVDSVEQDQ